MPGRDIVVIGASAGGVSALQNLVRQLPPRFPASIFVVQHVSSESRSVLPTILNRVGPVTALHPADGERVRPERIYVAPADHHMALDDGRVRITRGPQENRHRPSVDVLFRSAAHFYGPRVIGVVLTGFLDDGTAGLIAIKRHGGIAIVQDPNDAEAIGMPFSAVENAKVDYVVPLSEMGELLRSLVTAASAEREEKGVVAMSKQAVPAQQNGKPSPFSCPDCSGVLWEVEDENLVRFRCRIGHAYSAESMAIAQSEALERALWAGVRSLEESRDLARKMAQRAQERGNEWLSTRYEERATLKESDAAVLRQLLHREERPLGEEIDVSQQQQAS